MQGALAVLLITLGLGQLASTHWGWRAASLVGPNRRLGYGLGLWLLILGATILPATWSVLWWTLPAGLLTVAFLLGAGSFIMPPRHPDWLFTAEHPAHAECQPVQIPDGDYIMPGFLLYPPGLSAKEPDSIRDRMAVCVVPGAGDTKSNFKWRLVQALLAEGLIVLTVDLPGHGDYRQRPMAYPDCLSAIPAAIAFLRKQPGVKRVGLIGISLGGAVAIRSLANISTGDHRSTQDVDALAIFATPTRLHYTQALFYREMWNTYRAPVLSLLKEITVKQMRQSWYTGGYYSQHNTVELFDLLNPVEGLAQINDLPILLVYSQRDRIAPPEAGQTLQQVAPKATLLKSKKASHVTLTLMPEINQQVAGWLREQLEMK